MKESIRIYLQFILLNLLSISFISAETILEVDFNNHTDGQYTKEMMNEDWQTPTWNNGVDDGRVSVVSDPAYNDKSIEVLYPELGVGPSMGGAQWQFRFNDFEEVYASYYIYFPRGWDGVKGGKLPGLCGEECPTGGDTVTGYNGFSARYMFRPNMKLVIYCYHVDKPGTWGEDFELDYTFERENWYKLTQRIKLNTPGQKNGEIQVWVNDQEALLIDTLRFRLIDTVKIDKFYFSTFYGGSSPDWAPLTDQYIYFDEFKIYTEATNFKNQVGKKIYGNSKIVIYRPATGEFWFHIPQKRVIAYSLYNLQGVKVGGSFIREESNGVYPIQRPGTGIYILKVMTPEGIFNHKLAMVD